MGAAYCAFAAALTAVAAFLSSFPFGVAWALGQILFAFAFLEWFVLLHEAGHRTLFRHRDTDRT